MLGEPRTIRTIRAQSGAQDTIATSRRNVPCLAVTPNSSWVQAVFHDSLRSACQLRSHDRCVPAGFILLVPAVFAGVSRVVPSHRGRTGNRGGPSERGSSFSCPPSAEPSLVRESNRRTDRERVLHGPWFSWSPIATSFPAPTSSNVDLSEAWQSPDFTTRCAP